MLKIDTLGSGAIYCASYSKLAAAKMRNKLRRYPMYGCAELKRYDSFPMSALNLQISANPVQEHLRSQHNQNQSHQALQRIHAFVAQQA